MFGLTRPFSKQQSPPATATAAGADSVPATQSDDRWLALVALFPAGDPDGRMKALRTVESIGCGVLREGVYLLPDAPEHRVQFDRLGEYVTSIGGTVHVLCVTGGDKIQDDLFRTLFDRSDAYNELAKTIESLKAGFGVSSPNAIAHVLERQREAFEQIAAIDFFESRAKADCARLLAETERAVGTLLFPDAGKLAARMALRKQFLGRSWATTTPLTVDRLATAWFIRRYIDAGAPLEWIDKSGPVAPDAITYGFEGARFARTQARVTFEEMLSFFQLQKNLPLVRLALIVHAIEKGDVSVAEAVAFEARLGEARGKCASDDEYVARANEMFDALIEEFRIAGLQKVRG